MRWPDDSGGDTSMAGIRPTIIARTACQAIGTSRQTGIFETGRPLEPERDAERGHRADARKGVDQDEMGEVGPGVLAPHLPRPLERDQPFETASDRRA